MTSYDRGLVLGPGGVVGTAWLAGLAQGLRSSGVDLGAADLIVGTSAGAIVGAMLAGGEDLSRLSTARPSSSSSGPSRIEEVFAVLAGGAPDALRQVGAIALATSAGPEEGHLSRIGRLVTARAWPSTALLIPAIDTATGEPVVWDAASGAPLLAAVASSCAVPGVFPPITVNGSRYMDGAFRAGSNADLAADARSVVLVEPLAHLFPSAPPAEGVVAVAPDAGSLAAFGADLHDAAAWAPSYQAGVRQAAAERDRIATRWRFA
ncbi:patatin-like phospholipase family protein [Nonomuraea sp. NPDC050556]|uniref:patatin-like phospholipase family protein n=1 Tax=Nonomuraea sp. NPDC050556 TaxID=3364369 RepID=UPI003797E08C